MHVIEGRDTDLLSPFPPREYRRIFSWLHCYKTVYEGIFPDNEADLAECFARRPDIETFGIIDKNNFLGIRHDVPLIGMYTLQKDSDLNANIHVISTRKAWGSRLVDQAGRLLVTHAFNTYPTLERITSMILSNNAPAKALARRNGFRYEGCIRNAIKLKTGIAHMALFGLTRQDWIDKDLANEIIEPVLLPRMEKDKESVA